MESDRQVAAICVSRLFKGMGHEIRKDSSGVGYRKEGSSKFTDSEKILLKNAFEFFLSLIEKKE